MAETTRQRQKRQTRERILEAARTLMAGGRGLDSLGLREVARESGLAATSLYNHFPDMDALGLALIDSCCFRLRSAMEYERRSMIEIGPARAVKELVGRFVRYLNDYENDFRLLVQQRLGSHDRYRMRIQRELQLLVDELAEDVRQAVAAQGREPVPAEQEAEAAIAIMFGAGISMLDNTTSARRVLADHACLQLEMMALGGRMMAQGMRL
ncbi:MAG: TetR family transcriptional regulator [Alcanivorax sp.]|jgi:AcrR family transcriptional regulator|uniref:TetR family transcriptional regulator n=1 Tax=Alcanivorax sp. TaxID=1872427 RepID=UPI001991D1EF|nr:TetR family transcriptional regulator [Alcanivorax sp.]MBD3642890.1 TetR family transcriptional regulator [Alcanivorax sp.]MDF1725761.1 TetR family transcriptional regulator [Alcanivorax sp.]